MRCLPKVFWACGVIVMFLAACLGYLLGTKPPPAKPLPLQVTLNFYGFDTDGKLVGATDQFGAHLTNPSPQKPYQLTRDAGYKMELVFTPDMPVAYRQHREKVTWPTQQEYLGWLDEKEAQLKNASLLATGLRKHLKTYRADAGRNNKNTFDIPVIFDKIDKK